MSTHNANSSCLQSKDQLVTGLSLPAQLPIMLAQLGKVSKFKLPLQSGVTSLVTVMYICTSDSDSYSAQQARNHRVSYQINFVELPEEISFQSLRREGAYPQDPLCFRCGATGGFCTPLDIGTEETHCVCSGFSLLQFLTSSVGGHLWLPWYPTDQVQYSGTDTRENCGDVVVNVWWVNHNKLKLHFSACTGCLVFPPLQLGDIQYTFHPVWLHWVYVSPIWLHWGPEPHTHPVECFTQCHVVARIVMSAGLLESPH